MDTTKTESTPKEVKQIEAQINLLVSAGEELSQKLLHMAGRLSPVVRNKQPHKEPDEKIEPADSLVEIATSIRSIRYSIEADTKMVMDILERLEI